MHIKGLSCQVFFDNEAKSDDFLYKINFYCKNIKSIKCDVKEDGCKIEINFEDENGLKRNIELVERIYHEVYSQKLHLNHIYYSSNNAINNSKDLYPELLETHDIHEFSKGRIGYRGIFLKLLKYFDFKFIKMAEFFEAEEAVYPTFIPESDLDTCSYINSFPQHLNFLSHLEEDIDQIDSYVKERDKKYYNKDRYVLSPAVCLHCYIELKNSIHSYNNPFAISTKGKCFRYESKNLNNPNRLWDFTMREIVFFGNENYVKYKRQECMDYIIDFVEKLKLSATIESSADPFFISNNNERRFQMMGKLKYEVRLKIPHNNSTIAVGSFNLHRDFFGKAYNIKSDNNDYIFSGCTAFGLERWAYAFISQYGLSMDRWPEDVMRFMNSYT